MRPRKNRILRTQALARTLASQLVNLDYESRQPLHVGLQILCCET